MGPVQVRAFIDEVYRRVYGAENAAGFGHYLAARGPQAGRAALGYRRAGAERLFLEQYLDHPIEYPVSTALGRTVERERIVEIGNLAADNAWSMIALWGEAANDLGGLSDVVVATLTSPLRSMFRRVGIPVHELASADPTRLDRPGETWGSYYRTMPMVCAGSIAEGQRAIAAFLSRRRQRAA